MQSREIIHPSPVSLPVIDPTIAESAFLTYQVAHIPVEQHPFPYFSVTEIEQTLQRLPAATQKTLADFFTAVEPSRENHYHRLRKLLHLAAEVFLEPLDTYARQESSQHVQAFEESYFDWVALSLPFLQKSRWVEEREVTTGRQNINGDLLWTSQTSHPRFFSRTDTLEPAQKTDIARWQEPSGLPFHLAIAAWGGERFLRLLQENICQQHGVLTTEQEAVLSLNPEHLRISLALHDCTRLITHDTFGHTALHDLFVQLLGIPPELALDYDLGQILELSEVDPSAHNGGLPLLELDPKTRFEPQEAHQRSLEYIDSLLAALRNRGEKKPEIMLIFWWLDAFIKLNPNYTYHVQQPNDAEQIFLGHTGAHYNYQTGNQAEQERKHRYYSRQYDLAKAVEIWIRQSLGLSNKELWRFFFELNETALSFIDEKHHFSYHFVPANTPALPWKSPIR